MDKIDELTEKNRRYRTLEIVIATEEHLKNEERRAQLFENTSLEGFEILQLLKQNGELMERIVNSQEEKEY